MIILDTHVWLWWLHDPKRLSRRATTAIRAAEKASVIRVSVMSVWEIAVKVQIGKLVLPHDVATWFEKARQYPGVTVEPLCPADAIASNQLPGSFHRDPVDRILVAMARRHGASLATVDEKIIEYPHVRTVQ